MITLAGKAELEREVKKSRFLARSARADTPEEALSFLEAVSDPGATHNCFAYRIGTGYRSSDDGEPAGSSGRPILAAIDGQGLDHVVVVVTRWFGGIKLGVGGLVRAYGGTAAECLRLAEKLEVRPEVDLVVEVTFDSLGALYPLVERFGAVRVEEGFTEQGARLVLRLDEARVDGFSKSLADATRGRSRVHPK